MNKVAKIFFVILFCCGFFLSNPASAKINDIFLDFDKIKKKLSFKKKKQEQKPKMVETKQEWEIQSLNIPLSERVLEKKEEKIDKKKFHVPEANYIFEKYNYPQGARALNTEDIKNKLYSYPYMVSDINCRYAAYPKYYFSPDINQISSEFYVEKLDTSKTKQKRILDYNHKQESRKPIIEAGMYELYPNLFRGLTLVDWSNDSKKLLIKEKVGSLLNGVYKTYLYIHFMSNDIESAHTIKLIDFDEAIKNYFIDYQNVQLVKYRYDIEPLGFSADDDNLIVVNLFVYDSENKKIFLGVWGYDVVERKTMLISTIDPVVSLSANGLILKQVID